MKNESILAIFYSDENNLIYDNIKRTGNFSEEKTNQLKTLSFRFLGPLFLSTIEQSGKGWKIDSIESSLSMRSGRSKDVDILQSFFCLNSFVDSEGQNTILSTLIGSSYTEDIKMLYNKLSKYVHPSIVQGKIVNESIYGSDFKFNKFIEKELQRAVDLFDFSLGSPRKMYWEEQQNYVCVGVIERRTDFNRKINNLYALDKSRLSSNALMLSIPPYYLIAILPDYYEKLINETLELFNIPTVLSNVHQIELSNNSTKAIYMEEFSVEKELKESYGVILVPKNNSWSSGEANNIAFYKKKLRLILDQNKKFNQVLPELNNDLKFEAWGAVTEEELATLSKNFETRNN